jgi:hypothetical protein
LSPPLGNERFYRHIEQMTGQRREGKPRVRPRKASEAAMAWTGKGSWDYDCPANLQEAT